MPDQSEKLTLLVESLISDPSLADYIVDCVLDTPGGPDAVSSLAEDLGSFFVDSGAVPDGDEPAMLDLCGRIAEAAGLLSTTAAGGGADAASPNSPAAAATTDNNGAGSDGAVELLDAPLVMAEEDSVRAPTVVDNLPSQRVLLNDEIGGSSEDDDSSGGSGGSDGSDKDGSGGGGGGGNSGSSSKKSSKAKPKKMSRRDKKKAARMAAAKKKADEALDARETVVAVSQVSRFHRETVTSEANPELLLVDISIQAAGRDLITSAKLHLFPGRRYALIGRNGLGKSTLLRSLANKSIVGFPPALTTWLVDETPSDDRPVLDIVVDADVERTELLAEEALLRKSVELSHDAPALRVLAGRAKRAMDDIRAIADKRSGAYGFNARNQLLVLEAEYKEALAVAANAEADLARTIGGETGAADASGADAADAGGADAPGTDGGAGEPAATATSGSDGEADGEGEGEDDGPPLGSSVTDFHQGIAVPLLADIMERLEAIDAFAREGEAAEILSSMGFTDKMMEETALHLSGGWRMRIALAQVLLMKPHLLLLDEPTKHLDLPAVLWLSDFLSRYEGMMLVVSHDRSFLNAVTTETIVLRHLTLTQYGGNYDWYQAKVDQTRRRQLNELEVVEKKRAAIQATIQYGKSAARAHGDDKRLGQVASRKKKLNRLGQERADNGGKWKMFSGMGTRKEVTVDMPDPPVNFSFPEPEPVSTLGDVLTVDDVSVAYGDNVVLDHVMFSVGPTSRIAFVGANGGGKSTLLSVMAGTKEPDRGVVHKHLNHRIAYFSQHGVDNLDGGLTPVEYVQSLGDNVSAQDARKVLGGFGLSGDVTLHRMATLSGGQKARVLFAGITFPHPPHILILDEPTNFLDIDTLDALTDALNAWPGALVLVSHDQALLAAVEADIYHMVDGKPIFLEGGLSEYVASVDINAL